MQPARRQARFASVTEFAASSQLPQGNTLETGIFGENPKNYFFTDYRIIVVSRKTTFLPFLAKKSFFLAVS